MSFLLLLGSASTGGGWVPPTGTDYPTTFSPTERGEFAAGFSIYADGLLRVVRHEASSNWLSIRTVAGIADGEKVSCWATVTGTSSYVGIAIGTSSTDLNTYAGYTAQSFCLFGYTNAVYNNGGSVATTTGTLSQNDRVRMDVDRVADTVRFYLQSGGTGSYVAMCDAIDISSLGTGTLYPIASLYHAAAVLTWDFGNGDQTPPSGFTAGPLGSFLPWTYPMLDAWLHSDTGRMWENSTDVGVNSPNVIAGDPVGAWYGIQYALLRSNATSSARLQYETAGVLYDATGATKYLPASYSRNYNDPFYCVIRCIDMATSAPAVGAVAAASIATVRVGFAASSTTDQPRINGTSPTVAGDALSADHTVAISYDGTNYIIVDSDGTVYTGAGGSGTTNTDTLLFRALTANAGVGKIVYWQCGSTALTETELRNLHWAAGEIA